MKLFLRQCVDWMVGVVPVGLWAYLFKSFVRRPELAQRAGYTIYPRTFFNPFPLEEEIDREALVQARDVPGINLRREAGLGLLQDLGRYREEWSQFPHLPDGRIEWWMTYPTLDSRVLYGMIRHFKPKRYVEIGCGYSTRVSTAALARNRVEGNVCEAVFVEPFPGSRLEGIELGGRFLQKKAQEVDLEVFESLEEGDILFLDTTHVIKCQNDVEFEFRRVLPRLRAGVLVHIHDIFTPYDYPAEWVIGDGPNVGANNEQYALECLLSGGRWEVVAPLFALWREADRGRDAAWWLTPDRPQAIWIRSPGFG